MTSAIGRALRTRTRRIVALLAVLAVTAAALIAGWPRTHPAPVAEIDVTITAPGGPGVSGTVSLDAGLYLPSVVPAPAVILAHGFGQSRSDMAEQAQELARDGFVVLAYSARGFGASTGQIGLDSLDYEVSDGRAVVDWLSHRDEVLQDGPGDPRVGVTGGSYGGALSLMLAGTDRRIDAVAAIATWNSLAQALFPNNGSVGGGESAGGDSAGGSPDGGSSAGSSTGSSAGLSSTPAAIADRGDGVFKRSWAATLMSSLLTGASPSGSDPAAVGCGRMMAALCQAYTAVAETGRLTTDMSRLLARSSPAAVAGDITAPTLLVQGEQDTLFGLDQADANARAIAGRGTTVAMSWYAGGHDGGAPDQATEDRITGWLHHYLFRTGDTPSAAFRYTVSGPVSDTGRARNRTLQVPTYPGLTADGAGSGNRPGSGSDGSAATGTPRVSVPLAGPTQTVINPPGGVPAAISSLPGVGSLLSSAVGSLATALPGQTAVFSSAPVTTTTVVTGSARVTLSVAAVPLAGAAPAGGTGTGGDTAGNPADSTGVLFVSLAPSGSAGSGVTTSDSDESSSGTSAAGSDGSGSSGAATAAAAALAGSTLAGNAVSPVRLAGLPVDGTPVEVTVDLPAVAFQLQAGQALQIRVSTTDQAYAGPISPAVYRVSLVGDRSVSVPEVGGTRVSAGEEPLGVLIGLIVLVVAGAVGLVLAGRVRSPRRAATAASKAEAGGPHAVASDTVDTTDTRDATTGSDHQSPLPLSISGLRKAYPGGVTAVEDVTFEVRQGQVLGLLGPNGAGKTTTLRMVMGLIAPTEGRILVFGAEVRPGAEILSRIGSFVEGAGFLPHLSGLANLELYWRATGRPARDAHLEEALQIADLGGAINRRVKTYSQGMRQRLAIAQAMLGLPDLLILDEPTNGLDPPQIHAMREVLRRYADTGRTVVVSSHLLAEVEQTCSHVVIVNRGRTIASGTVAELVSASGEMTFGLGDPESADRAATILSALDGVAAVAVTNGGVQADLGRADPSRAMRALLDAGIEITSAAPRNRLEDVFLDLVGGGDPSASTDGRRLDPARSADAEVVSR